MRVRVEPDAAVPGIVGDSGERWPFEIEFDTGAARIELAAETFEVRPLRWRQKVLLARYARAGGEFLGRQLLRLCTGGREPHGEREREVLRVLVEWINAPGDYQAGLPFDSRLLATIMGDVCRAMGLKPADLDSRDALEVEMLWHGAGFEAGRRLDASVPPRDPPNAWGTGNASLEVGETTVIRILPDPEPVVRVEREAETGVTALQSDQEPTGHREPEASRARGAGPPRSAPRPAETTRNKAAVRQIMAGRFRALGVSSAAAATTPAPEIAIPDMPRASERPQLPTPEPLAADPSHGAPDPVRSFPRVLPKPSASPAVASSAPAPEQAPVTAREQPRVARVEPIPTRLAAVDTDALFDELSDRLEQAAAELGVDLES